MALLHWKDKYSVGIPAVDYEHKELIDLINRLHDELGSRPHETARARTIRREEVH